MKKIFVFFALVFSITCLADFDNVRNEWMKGYTKMEAADKAAKAKRNQEAIQLYRSALAIFESVQRRYPQWNPTLLNYRISYCRQVLEQLSNIPEQKPETLSQSELVKLNKEYANTIAQLSEERRFLESRVEVLTDSLARARAEAAKSAGAETTLVTASKNRQKLEEANNLLQLRLREATKEIEALKKGASSEEKDSAKTAQKLKKTEDLLRQSQSDLAKANDELKAVRRQLEATEKTVEKMQKEKTEADSTLKKLQELELNHHTEIVTLQGRIKALQKNYDEMEKTLRKREAALEKSKGKEAQEETRRLTEELQAARTKNIALDEELLTLRADFDKLKRQLQSSEEQRIKLADQITSDTQGWKDAKKKEEDIIRQLDETRRKLQETQEANAQLQQRLDAQIELTRKQEENITKLTEGDAESSAGIARRVKLQEAQIAKLAADVSSLTTQLKDADPLVRKSHANIMRLEQQLADARQDLKRTEDELARLRAERDKEAEERNDSLKKAAEELDKQKPAQDSKDQAAWKALYEKSLELAKQSLANEAEMRGRNRALEDRFLETQEQLDECERDLTAAKNAQVVAETAAKDAQAKLDASNIDAKTARGKEEAAKGISTSLADTTRDLKDKNLAINALQAKVAVLEAQLREADDRARSQTDNLSALAGGDADKVKWAEHIKQLTARLEQEQKHRRALEMALAEKETSAQEAQPATALQKTDNGPDMAEERRRREREKDAVLKGYLRQAIDAEKQEKVEAAQWNYQKALELDPDNRIALQRLGIIASNLGNDQDTIKYLQRAFRLDPDDPDTLFALGYSLIRQSEPDWAVSMLSRAIALNPQNADVARTYGMALATLGWTQAAELQLEKAYNLKKDDSEAPLALAILFASSKPPRIDDAKKWYQIAIKNGAQHDPGLDAVLK
ncbi:MAG: tetratricopeptide repeat protein [Victivallales bacterium]|nr:tetratricopeptide repeat protein [Victivallales bacterium]